MTTSCCPSYERYFSIAAYVCWHNFTFQSTLEPPAVESVQRSLESLHSMGFLSRPDDEAVLTDTGRFASGLGVDLQLGRMVREDSANADILRFAALKGRHTTIP